MGKERKIGFVIFFSCFEFKIRTREFYAPIVRTYRGTDLT